MNKTIVVFAGNDCAPEKEHFYFSLAYDLGKNLAQAGFTLANGAGNGLMDQTLKGAFEAGGDTIGIGLDIENRKHSPFAKKLKTFKDLKERQKQLVALADGFVALPGGMGTAYEILEIIALKRVEQIPPKAPLILLGEYYGAWKTIFGNMVKEGFSQNQVLNLFDYAATPEETAIKLKAAF